MTAFDMYIVTYMSHIHVHELVEEPLREVRILQQGRQWALA